MFSTFEVIVTGRLYDNVDKQILLEVLIEILCSKHS